MLANKPDPVSQASLGDPISQLILETSVFGGRSTCNQRRPAGMFRQQRDHRVDEQVCALLVPDAPKAADIALRRIEPDRRRRLALVCGRHKACGVDAMHHNRVGHLEIGRSLATGRNHRVHPSDQELGPAGMLALRGRCEHKRQRRAQNVSQHDAAEHLGIPARVPHASPAAFRPAQQGRHLPPAHLRQCVGQARSQSRDIKTGLKRHKLNDCTGDAGKPAFEVGNDQPHPRHVDAIWHVVAPRFKPNAVRESRNREPRRVR